MSHAFIRLNECSHLCTPKKNPVRLEAQFIQPMLIKKLIVVALARLVITDGCMTNEGKIREKKIVSKELSLGAAVMENWMQVSFRYSRRFGSLIKGRFYGLLRIRNYWHLISGWIELLKLRFIIIRNFLMYGRLLESVQRLACKLIDNLF